MKTQKQTLPKSKPLSKRKYEKLLKDDDIYVKSVEFTNEQSYVCNMARRFYMRISFRI